MSEGVERLTSLSFTGVSRTALLHGCRLLVPIQLLQPLYVSDEPEVTLLLFSVFYKLNFASIILLVISSVHILLSYICLFTFPCFYST